ncbi:MAG: argininosuccinate lyase [Nitrospinae bacterium]|nr:argininosuccinate lyase [Nitrospinota bacterium]
MKKKLWGGRFSKPTDNLVEEFTASISFDRRMYRQDIRGSIAHAKMLAKCGIITKSDSRKIVSGLREIQKEIENGEFEFTVAHEDIHMNIERRLTEKIGQAGGKLHTARSRNDQVALDIRMYLKDEIGEITGLIPELVRSLVRLARENIGVLMPGYTHLQRAQPIRFAHHLLAYVEMFLRDGERLQDCLKRADVMPLGSAALAGTGYPIDREYCAGLLGFRAISKNSMDAVSDRDFAIEFCAAASIMMMHFSRLSEELVLWSSQEFRFVRLADGFCTGSSIMPQKKNPDVPELVRGKTGRVYGHLLSLLTIMKSLPLAYNKDMQEDKEPLFDTVDTLKNVLAVTTALMGNITPDKKNMENALRLGFTTATEMADYLAGRGLPFREAHEVAGKVVSFCEKRGMGLEEVPLEKLREFSPIFNADVFEAIDVRSSADRKTSPGGSALVEIEKRLKELERIHGR